MIVPERVHSPSPTHLSLLITYSIKVPETDRKALKSKWTIEWMWPNVIPNTPKSGRVVCMCAYACVRACVRGPDVTKQLGAGSHMSKQSVCEY